MIKITDRSTNTLSAYCPKCLSLLKFCPNDVHPANTPVQLTPETDDCGSSCYPFIVCPNCSAFVDEIYDINGTRKVSGPSSEKHNANQGQRLNEYKPTHISAAIKT